MDYHLTWNKCCRHWDNVQWPWPISIPQKSRSHKTFNIHSTHACVQAITYVCIDGLPSNLVQMLSLLRRCAYIQDYLGYRSNNLYFLFSHSWPVVVYNYGQVQRTSQVERKTKCSTKNWQGYSRPLDCLVENRLVLTTTKTFINSNHLQSNDTWVYRVQNIKNRINIRSVTWMSMLFEGGNPSLLNISMTITQ